MKKMKKKGFTLVELLLVVGIIALGAIVAYITFPKVQASSRANAEASNINTIASSIKNLYGASRDFDSLQNDGNKTILRAKGFPDQMVVDSANAVINNSFGGTVEITSEYLYKTSSYKIVYNGVPGPECIKLATGVGNNFLQVKTNGEAIKAYPNSEPVDIVKASEACNRTDGQINNMTFSGN